jgi:excisionase family DNA binding protein
MVQPDVVVLRRLPGRGGAIISEHDSRYAPETSANAIPIRGYSQFIILLDFVRKFAELLNRCPCDARPLKDGLTIIEHPRRQRLTTKELDLRSTRRSFPRRRDLHKGDCTVSKQLAAAPAKASHPPAAATMQPRRRFYFIKEAAAELRTSVTTVYLLLARKELRGKKIGGRLAIMIDELDRFLAECPDAEFNMPSLTGDRKNIKKVQKAKAERHRRRAEEARANQSR